LDLKSRYWQIKIHSENTEKMAFLIGNGLWFKVMSFDLCNAPAIFEHIMEQIFKICLVYLDDMIIFGKSFEEMLFNLEKIFHCLRET